MIRSVLRWMLAIVLIGAGGAGAYLYYLYHHCDEILRKTLQAKVAELAPKWDVELGRCRFNLRGEIVVDDVKLRVGENRAMLLEVPQAVIVIDRDQFVDKQTVVQQVRLTRPQVWLSRDAAGLWNVLKLPPRPKSSSPVAEVRIEQATLHVQIDDPAGGPSANLTLRHADVEMVPSGKRRLLIAGRGEPELAQAISAKGEWDLDEARWNGTLTVQQLKVGSDLQAAVETASPGTRRALDLLAAKTQELLDERQASAPEGSILQTSGERLRPVRSLGLAGLVDARLTLGQAAGEPLDWSVSGRIHDAELTHALLPFTLYELKGDFTGDPDKVNVKNLTAHNGPTNVAVSCNLPLLADPTTANVSVVVRELPFEPRVRSCLCGALAKIYDSLQGRGRCDMAMTLTRNVKGEWVKSGTISIKDSQVTHTSFPLTAESVNGTITLKDNGLWLNLSGRASRRVITLAGRVTNVGPECSAVFEICGNGIPLDERFRAACTPKVQAVFDHLQLQGEFDGKVTIIRPAGLRRPYTVHVAANLKNCSVQPKSFNYAITGITARLEGSGQRWKLTNARGRHDLAAISGNCDISPIEDGRCFIDINLKADGVPLDVPLQSALDERWQTLWKEFTPSGRINTDVHVSFIEKEPPKIEFNEVKFIDAALTLKSFPYPLDSVQATLNLRNGLLNLESFSGRHEEMRLSMTGHGDFTEPGIWRMTLENIVIDDLTPDRRFRKALPEKIRDVVETLDPRNSKLSLSGMIDLAGLTEPGGSVTSAWDLELIHSGTSITAGVDLDDLFGKVRMRGTWDGVKAKADGEIDLDSVVFQKHQLTSVRGPFSINGTQLVIGSRDALNYKPKVDGQPAIPNSDRLTAQFIGGTIGLDGAVKLNEQTDYHVKMTLAGGRLEQYVQLYMPGQQNKIMGLMNGSLDLSGKGNSARDLSGRGRLLVSPASLYDLPIIVAVFNLLKFTPADKTAFRSAGFDFKVGNAKFLFDRIQLIGDSISLTGAGTVGFDGNVAMDFYSKGGRANSLIPLVKPIIDSVTMGFIRVSVRGTLAKPQAVIQTMPQMDDAMRAFLGVGPGSAMRR